MLRWSVLSLFVLALSSWTCAQDEPKCRRDYVEFNDVHQGDICVKVFMGHRYNWMDAGTLCAKDGANLVEIHNQGKQDFLEDAIAAMGNVQLGCYSNNNFPTADLLPGLQDDNAACAAVCDENNFKYSAMKRSDACYCFEEDPTADLDAVGDDFCDVPCAGNPDELCGGDSIGGLFARVTHRKKGSRDQSDYWTNLVDFGSAGDFIWMTTRASASDVGYENWLDADGPDDDLSQSAVILDNDTGSGFRWRNYHPTHEALPICEMPKPQPTSTTTTTSTTTSSPATTSFFRRGGRDWYGLDN